MDWAYFWLFLFVSKIAFVPFLLLVPPWVEFSRWRAR